MQLGIAWKTQGNPQIASARYRALLPSRHLRGAGWPCETFEPARAGRYGVVVFQKVYDDANLELLRGLKRRGAKTVFDLCDNLFHYDLDDPPAAARRTEQLKRMIDAVDAVTVSTAALRDAVREATGRDDSFVIDDAVEVPRLNPLARGYYRLRGGLGPRGAESFRVVWYGIAGRANPRFGMIDLEKVLPALSALHREVPLSLSVISNSAEMFREYTRGADFPVRYHEWGRRSFPYLFEPHDACVLPVSPNPLTLCKTSNRLLLSLMLGVPVVADRIPSYEEFAPFVRFGDWEQNLRAYATDAPLRRRHVREGRGYITANYNKEHTVAQWSALFETLLGDEKKRTGGRGTED